MANRKNKRRSAKGQKPTLAESFPALDHIHIAKGAADNFAWSNDERYLAFSITSGEIFVQAATAEGAPRQIGTCRSKPKLVWSPSGHLLAFSDDMFIRVFDAQINSEICYITGETCDWITPKHLIAFSSIQRDLRLVDVSKRGSQGYTSLLNRSESIEYNYGVNAILAHAPSRQFVVVRENVAEIWSVAEKMPRRLRRIGVGKRRFVTDEKAQTFAAVQWEQNLVAIVHPSAADEVAFYNLRTGNKRGVIKAHTREIVCMDFIAGGTMLATLGAERQLKFWDIADFSNIASVAHHHRPAMFATSPRGTKFGILERSGTVITSYDVAAAVDQVTIEESVRYITGRVVLLGDSGVGKTALGCRISTGTFKEHESTHGRQFWTATALGTTLKDGAECESVIWDLAGQPDYRLTHTLFLEGIDVAALVFDASHRQQPLAGVEYWLRHLSSQDRAPKFVLVGARCDRGTPTVTAEALNRFCENAGIEGGYVSTSSSTGEGVDALIQCIKRLLDWDNKPRTVTSRQFRKLRETLLANKAEHPANILPMHAFLQAYSAHSIPSDEIEGALPHLEAHGFVSVLADAQGEQWVLTEPVLLDNVAASIVLAARRQPHGLGSLDEAALVEGRYDFGELPDITGHDKRFLIQTALSRFFRSAVCYRETLGQQSILIFPSLISEQPPEQMFPSGLEDDVTFLLTGSTERVYPSLAVLLGYTNLFARHSQWKDQAQYRFETGEVCGFKHSSDDAGSIMITLRYGANTADSTKAVFRGIIERFLSRHDVQIVACPRVVCKRCECVQPRESLLRMIKADKKYGFCGDCGTRFEINASTVATAQHSQTRGVEAKISSGTQTAIRRTLFEDEITKIKAVARDLGTAPTQPACFICYPWSDPSVETWVLQLASDLGRADIRVLLDRWESGPGDSLPEFIQSISAAEHVIVVGTPDTKKKYETVDHSDPVIRAELDMIAHRIANPTRFGRTVVPVLRQGIASGSFIPILEPLVHLDFRNDEKYFERMKELVWRLLQLPRDHKLFFDLVLRQGQTEEPS